MCRVEIAKEAQVLLPIIVYEKWYILIYMLMAYWIRKLKLKKWGGSLFKRDAIIQCD